MDIVKSHQDIQNSLLEWFSDNGRNWIPWKLNKDGSIPQSGEIISLSSNLIFIIKTFSNSSYI